MNRWSVGAVGRPPARGLAAVLAALAALAAAEAAGQEIVEVQATPDSVFEKVQRRPLYYYTTYDRDRSNGTWGQTLSYGVTSRRLAFNTNASVSALDDVTRPGFGGRSGRVTGRLDARPRRGWIVTVDGRYDRVTSGDDDQSSRQRRNRFLIQTQYAASVWRGLTAQAILSTEFQQDQNLSIRPFGGVRKVVGVDTFYVFGQRDSSFTAARQDGATGSLRWEPISWLKLDAVAAANRIRPTTRSYLRDFVSSRTGGASEQIDAQRFENPNSNQKYKATLNADPSERLRAKIELTTQSLEQSYFEKQLRGQEHRTLEQRTGLIHVEQVPLAGFTLALDGTLSRSQSDYALRRTNTSLVNRRAFMGSAGYSGPSDGRAIVSFQVDRSQNERQTTQNGVTISRFLTANGGRRVSKRLYLDGSGTVSLLSLRYENPVSDRDNARSSVTVGGRYEATAACATSVHFSTNRGHSIAIDPSASGNNSVETTYQMDATLSLRSGRTFSVNQSYLLSAVYQIYDYVESRNTLNRIRRIDTVVSDTIFSFAQVGLIHNFLFRDSGTYIREAGEAERAYSASVETYQQNLAVTIGIRPLSNVLFSITQSLANTRNRFVGSGTETVSNRWNLTASGEIDRPLPWGASVRGAVRHIGAYTERVAPTDDLFEEKYWIAGVSFQKSFE